MFDLLTGSGWIIPLALAQTVAFILLIRFLDLYEREPLLYLAFMALWGGTVAVVAVALLNGAIGTFLSSALSPEASAVFGPAISAPLVEELAKGMALGIAFQASYWWSRRFGGLEFEGVTDGIVYGAAIGLGFAFTENVVFFLTSASQEGLQAASNLFRDRVDLFGFNSLGHAVYTGAFGAGLGLATWTRSRKATLGFPLLGLGAGMLMHAVHNGLVSVVLAGRYGITVAANFLTVDASGEQLVATYNAADAVRKVIDSVFVGMFFVAIALWLWYQRRLIRDALAEEARRGLVSSEELEALPRYWQRVGWYWRLLGQRRFGDWRTTRRIHNELIDLAFLRRRVAQGREHEGKVDELRERIAGRKTRAAVA